MNYQIDQLIKLSSNSACNFCVCEPIHLAAGNNPRIEFKQYKRIISVPINVANKMYPCPCCGEEVRLAQVDVVYDTFSDPPIANSIGYIVCPACKNIYKVNIRYTLDFVSTVKPLEAICDAYNRGEWNGRMPDADD